MRRIVSLMVLIGATAMSTAAFADSTAKYTGSLDNTAEVSNAGSYSTVLITKVSDNAGSSASLDESSIAFVDQNDGTFPTALMNFIMKANPTYGKYKVQFGSPSGNKSTTYFYVGVDTPSGDIAMTRVGEKKVRDLWRVGYYAIISAEDYNDCQALKIAFDSNPVANIASEPSTVVFGGYDLKDGESFPTVAAGDVMLAFQVNDVPDSPAAYKDSITVYLSKDGLSENFVFEQ